MIVQSDTRDVPDFMMKQMISLRLTDKKYSTDEQPISSLVASSNVFGLLFVGTPEKLLVIKVADIAERDASSSKKITIDVGQFPHKEAWLPSSPSFVSLSSDHLTLLVCITKSGCPVGWLYDVRGFARQNGGWNPFQEVRLSSCDGVTVQDCAWNPTMANLLAICLSDGSLVTVEVNNTQITINSLPPITGAQAISWSPKGKQLVVARPSMLVQYKPDLKEAKTIPFSGSDIEMSQPMVCGLQWISTVQFLVVFVDQKGEQHIPHLFIVNLHKSGPPTFTCFYDICFTDPSSNRPNRYITLTIPTWNVILACASNATDVGVMGPPMTSGSSEHPEWIQWTLDDSARAEMPLDGGESEPKPLGMAVDMSSQVSIPWLENQTLPPMPILFVLSSSGTLHPFYVINLLNGIPTQLNQPPQLLSSSNERPALANLRPSTASALPLAASTPLPASGKAAIPRTNLGDRFAAAAAAAATTATDTVATNNAPAMNSSNSSSANVGTSFFAKPPAVGNQLAPTVTPTTPTSNFRVKPETNTANFYPSVPNLTGEMKITADDPNMGAAAAILRDELTKFAQDLQDFKSRSTSLKVHVASEEEKQRLVKMTSELSDFSKELVLTTKNQDEEVRSLYTEVVEISALLEEARVRHARRKNPRYSQLLKTRPLDPANRRKLDCIERLHIHIEQQLEEAARSLESSSRDRNKDRQRKVEIPVTRVIYEAIRSNSKVIMQLKSRLERIKVQINDQQLRLAGAALDVLRSKNSNESHHWDSDLAVLADSLLTTRIKDGNEKNSNSVHAVVPQVSPEKQAMLRQVLTQRPVARIRAVRPETASESRLLSNLNSLLHNSKQMDDKKTSSAETSTIRSKSTLLSSSNTVVTGIQPQKTETSSTLGFDMILEKANSKMIPSGRQTSVGSFSPLSAVPATGSAVGNAAKNLPSKVEDVTPPSSPLNFDQKAKAISGQHMISSLSLIPQAKSTVESEARTFVSHKPGDIKMPFKLSTPESSSSFGSISASKPTGSAFAAAEVPSVINKNLITSIPSTAIGNPVATTTYSAEEAKIKSIFSSASTTSVNPPVVITSPSISKQPSSTSLFGLASPPPYSSTANISGPTSENTVSTSEKNNLLITSQLPKTNFSFRSPPSSGAPPVVIPASGSSLVTKPAKESNPLITLTTTLPSTAIPSSTFSFALAQSPSTASEPPKVLDKAITGASNFSFNLNNTSSATTTTKTAASFSFTLPATSTNPPNISIGSAVTTSSAFSVNPSGTAGSSIFPLNTSGKVQSVFGVPPATSALTTVTTASSLLGSGSLFGQSTTAILPTVAPSPFAQVAPNTLATSLGQNVLPTSSSSIVSSTVSPLFASATSIASSQMPNLSSAISPTSNSLFINTAKVATAGLPASAATPLFAQATPSAGASSTSNSFAPVFGQSSFGGAPSGQNIPASNTSVFGQSAFGAPSSLASPNTGSLAAPLFGSSGFGRPTSGFMAGNNAFGQTVNSSASTTASPSSAQPLFGASAFSQTAASGVSNPGSSSLGLASNAFGSMGLGSMPNATATPNRNVFGGGSVFASQATSATGFGSSTPFGNQGAAPVSSFGSPPASGFGSMGGGQTFGGAPAFGGSPLFGGKPTFGSPVSNNTPQPKTEPTGFVAFAAASNAPSFGALAGGGNNQPAFGGAAFPQNNAQSFGGGSSFSSWR